MTTPSRRAELPVSLVVAVRDEEATLAELLAGIDAQTATPDQVVLVDGGSTDRTLEIARAHARSDPRYLVVEAGDAARGRGRNEGIAAARNAWIAITDAGVRVEPQWLERLWAARHADPAAEVVYGNFEFDVRSFFEQCAAVAYGSPKRPTPAGPLRGPAVVSCLLHRRAFDLVGGFEDLRSGEDTMFVRAISTAEVRIAWAPDATIWWRLRPTLAGTFRRFRLYSFHNVRAGQQRYWHHRVARRYIPVAAGAALALRGSRAWLVLPAVTIGGRAANRVRIHTEGRGWAWRADPRRLALVTVLLLVNDAATAVGWIDAVRRRVPHPVSEPSTD